MTAEPIKLTNERPHSEAGSSTDASADHTCNCNHDDSEAIVLDGRTIPHAIRHAAIFGALDAIQPGFSLDLIAPHDPLPLLAQLQQSHPGAFTTSYLQRGPEAWKLRFTRVA
jgi:uncharacterized protein (DUF2249 family)